MAKSIRASGFQWVAWVIIVALAVVCVGSFYQIRHGVVNACRMTWSFPVFTPVVIYQRNSSSAAAAEYTTLSTFSVLGDGQDPGMPSASRSRRRSMRIATSTSSGRLAEWEPMTSRVAYKYALHKYSNGFGARPLDPHSHPILFAPGHQGSYKQVRSLAAAMADLQSQRLAAVLRDQLDRAPTADGSDSQRSKVGKTMAAASNSSALSVQFFSLDFGEEVTAFMGHALLDQAEFLNDCIAAVRTLYILAHEVACNRNAASTSVAAAAEHGSSSDGSPAVDSSPLDSPDEAYPCMGDSWRPPAVTVIGHSMGGFAARLSPLLPSYIPSSIATVITLATPHTVPPVQLDGSQMSLYRLVNREWVAAASAAGTSQLSQSGLLDIAALSISSGESDWQIWEGTTAIPASTVLMTATSSNGSNSNSTGPVSGSGSGAIDGSRPPWAWVSTLQLPSCSFAIDHLAILWCAQLVKAVTDSVAGLVEACHTGTSGAAKCTAHDRLIVLASGLGALDAASNSSTPAEAAATAAAAGTDSPLVVQIERAMVIAFGADPSRVNISPAGIFAALPIRFGPVVMTCIFAMALLIVGRLVIDAVATTGAAGAQKHAAYIGLHGWLQLSNPASLGKLALLPVFHLPMAGIAKASPSTERAILEVFGDRRKMIPLVVLAAAIAVAQKLGFDHLSPSTSYGGTDSTDATMYPYAPDQYAAGLPLLLSIVAAAGVVALAYPLVLLVAMVTRAVDSALRFVGWLVLVQPVETTARFVGAGFRSTALGLGSPFVAILIRSKTGRALFNDIVVGVIKAVKFLSGVVTGSTGPSPLVRLLAGTALVLLVLDVALLVHAVSSWTEGAHNRDDSSTAATSSGMNAPIRAAAIPAAVTAGSGGRMRRERSHTDLGNAPTTPKPSDDAAAAGVRGSLRSPAYATTDTAPTEVGSPRGRSATLTTASNAVSTGATAAPAVPSTFATAVPSWAKVPSQYLSTLKVNATQWFVRIASPPSPVGIAAFVLFVPAIFPWIGTILHLIEIVTRPERTGMYDYSRRSDLHIAASSCIRGLAWPLVMLALRRITAADRSSSELVEGSGASKSGAVESVLSVVSSVIASGCASAYRVPQSPHATFQESDPLPASSRMPSSGLDSGAANATASAAASPAAAMVSTAAPTSSHGHCTSCLHDSGGKGAIYEETDPSHWNPSGLVVNSSSTGRDAAAHAHDGAGTGAAASSAANGSLQQQQQCANVWTGPVYRVVKCDCWVRLPILLCKAAATNPALASVGWAKFVRPRGAGHSIDPVTGLTKAETKLIAATHPTYLRPHLCEFCSCKCTSCGGVVLANEYLPRVTADADGDDEVSGAAGGGARGASGLGIVSAALSGKLTFRSLWQETRVGLALATSLLRMPFISYWQLLVSAFTSSSTLPGPDSIRRELCSQLLALCCTAAPWYLLIWSGTMDVSSLQGVVSMLGWTALFLNAASSTS